MGARSYNPPSNDDSVAWASRLRNKNIAPSAEEAKRLKSHAIVDGYYPSLALVGRCAGGRGVAEAVRSKDASVRLAAAETFSHGAFGEVATAALAKLTADPSPKVRPAAVRALGMAANWRSQAAQQALIRLATDTRAELEDRLNATDAARVRGASAGEWGPAGSADVPARWSRCWRRRRSGCALAQR